MANYQLDIKYNLNHQPLLSLQLGPSAPPAYAVGHAFRNPHGQFFTIRQVVHSITSTPVGPLFVVTLLVSPLANVTELLSGGDDFVPWP